MTVANTAIDVIRAADGTPLRIKLRRAERMRTIRALGMIMPLFLFLIVSFIVPIAAMLFISVQNPEVGEVLPRTDAAGRSDPLHIIRPVAEGS